MRGSRTHRPVARGRRLATAAVSLAVLGVTLVGCSDEPKPVFQKSDATPAPVTGYDPSLEPSGAVLPLVPTAARRLEVTDFDQLRLVLGFGSVQSAPTEEERARFDAEAPRTAALTLGRLRAVDARLRADFGFGRDDVAWEASWDAGGAGDAATGSATGSANGAGSASGWVVVLHPSVSMASVQRAVDAGVGPLRGASVDADRRLVGVGLAAAPEQSWASLAEVTPLVGRTAVSTYVERGCVPFDTVYGAGMQAQLADAPALRVRRLDALPAFAVALGAELATAQLGAARPDAFDRARLADVLPSTVPEFSEVLVRPVADPSTGRIGYTLADPAAAARLVRARTLPFAICPG